MDATTLLLTPNLTVSVSGRRSTPAMPYFADAIGLWIDKLRPDCVMSGMALGVDQLAAEIALDRGRPVHAVLPGEWQSDRWSPEQRSQWRRLLSRCSRTTIIDKAPTLSGPGKLHHLREMFKARNTFMVQHSDLMIVCWDGIPNGGTYHALGQCVAAERPVLLLQHGENPRLLTDGAALRKIMVRRTAWRDLAAIA